MKELSEHRKKDICQCESCTFGPLAHFEQCKICGSTSYHKTIQVYIEPQEVKDEVLKT